MNQQYHIIILSCFLLVFLIIPPISALNESVENLSYQGNITEEISATDIQSMITHPVQYLRKSIVLKGIVTRVYPSQNQFTLADRIGCPLCATKNSLDSISVWYSGEIPKTMEMVQVSGLVLSDVKKGIHINATVVKPLK